MRNPENSSCALAGVASMATLAKASAPTLVLQAADPKPLCSKVLIRINSLPFMVSGAQVGMGDRSLHRGIPGRARGNSPSPPRVGKGKPFEALANRVGAAARRRPYQAVRKGFSRITQDRQGSPLPIGNAPPNSVDYGELLRQVVHS